MNGPVRDPRDTVTALRHAKEWVAEHGRNTNTALGSICEQAADDIEQLLEHLAAVNRKADYNAQRAAKLEHELYTAARFGGMVNKQALLGHLHGLKYSDIVPDAESLTSPDAIIFGLLRIIGDWPTEPTERGDKE